MGENEKSKRNNPGNALYRAHEEALVQQQHRQRTLSETDPSFASPSNISLSASVINSSPESLQPTRTDSLLMSMLLQNKNKKKNNVENNFENNVENNFENNGGRIAQEINIERSNSQKRIQTGSPMHTMSAHPTLPLYVAGNDAGHVGLWSFAKRGSKKETGQENGRLLCIYSSNGAQDSAINRVRFNPTGDRFAAVDASGFLRMYTTSHLSFYPLSPAISATSTSPTLSTTPIAPYYELCCNTRSLTDVIFLDTSSTIATSGMGSKMAVCVWDMLMPSDSSLVEVISVPGGGVTSLLSIPTQNTLVAGTADGKVRSFDLRMLGKGDTEMFQSAGHRGPVTSLSYNSSNGGCLASASKDGVVNVWSNIEGNNEDESRRNWSKQTLNEKGKGVMWWNDMSLVTWSAEGKVVLHTVLRE